MGEDEHLSRSRLEPAGYSSSIWRRYVTGRLARLRITDRTVPVTIAPLRARRDKLPPTVGNLPLRLDVFEILPPPFAEQKLTLQPRRRFRGHGNSCVKRNFGAGEAMAGQ